MHIFNMLIILIFFVRLSRFLHISYYANNARDMQIAYLYAHLRIFAHVRNFAHVKSTRANCNVQNARVQTYTCKMHDSCKMQTRPPTSRQSRLTSRANGGHFQKSPQNFPTFWSYSKPGHHYCYYHKQTVPQEVVATRLTAKPNGRLMFQSAVKFYGWFILFWPPSFYW